MPFFNCLSLQNEKKPQWKKNKGSLRVQKVHIQLSSQEAVEAKEKLEKQDEEIKKAVEAQQALENIKNMRFGRICYFSSVLFKNERRVLTLIYHQISPTTYNALLVKGNELEVYKVSDLLPSDSSLK